MTWEQYKKAVGLNERISELETTEELLKGSHLWYAYKNGLCRWEILAEWYILPIKHILDKYDKIIRQEIDDEIKKLKAEIETL